MRIPLPAYRPLHRDLSADDGPVADLRRALDHARPPLHVQLQHLARPTAEPLRWDDLAAVTRYFVSYAGVDWKFGQPVGPEMEMVVVGRLTDGRHFALVAATDNYGWSGEVYVHTFVADGYEDLWRMGLSDADRVQLELSARKQRWER